ncbi:MAG TPA: ester cyclase [Polyangiaceae bacterium]|nr:ester cyclase [Polyangiaceae bacterium]
MDQTANKELARRYFSLLNAKDLDGAAALTADDLKNHAAIPEAQGRSGLRRILGKVQNAFPDADYRCEDVFADADKVVCRVSMRGTNTGPIEFLRYPVGATNKRCETETIHIFRVAGGKIVEHWAGRDDVGVMRQLGQLPFAEKQS